MPSSGSDLLSGYLDVKISSRSRRGLTPWKAWQRQWCEIKKLDSIKNGVELMFKSTQDGTILSCVALPRSSTICRTESRTKQYAFGVFTLGQHQKPLLFLSGTSESNSQEWMSSIRKMLCIASYLPVGESNYHVSLVDNSHSRLAGLLGLYGVLGTNSQEITISDPCTGEVKISWKWFNFHQFHLQAPAHTDDENSVCVMHTSGEFFAGPGQLYLYCKEAPKLLHQLVGRGKNFKPNSGLITKRLSRSEGDLCCAHNGMCAPDSPLCFRSQTGSEDSGVRISIASDDSGNYVIKNKVASSLVSITMGVTVKTPGGSETNDDSLQDLSNISDNTQKTPLPRRESGVSLASGIYEEIEENPVKSDTPNSSSKKDYSGHIYENPIEILLDTNNKYSIHIIPPPLPPRRIDFYLENPKETNISENAMSKASIPYNSKYVSYKHRCNTLPAKDLSRISQIFTAESEYVVMTPSKTAEKAKEKLKSTILTENFYIPMSPVVNLKAKIESCYISMNGKKT